MKKSGVYKIINVLNNNVYVGSSINLERRKREHFNLLKKNKHINTHLQNSWNKYGGDSFEFIILEFCEKEKCTLIEQNYIDKYNPIYNINPRAGSSLGIKHKQETIEKIRKKQTGKIKSEETKKKIGDKNKGNYYRKKYIDLTEDEKKNYRNKSGFKKRRKVVLQLSVNNDIIKEWDSIQEIKRQLGHYPIHISRCCNNKRKTAYGFVWKFK